METKDFMKGMIKQVLKVAETFEELRIAFAEYAIEQKGTCGKCNHKLSGNRVLLCPICYENMKLELEDLKKEKPDCLDHSLHKAPPEEIKKAKEEQLDDLDFSNLSTFLRGKKVREKLNHIAFAEKIGVSPQTLNNINNGKTIRKNTYRDIVKVYPDVVKVQDKQISRAKIGRKRSNLPLKPKPDQKPDAPTFPPKAVIGAKNGDVDDQDLKATIRNRLLDYSCRVGERIEKIRLSLKMGIVPFSKLFNLPADLIFKLENGEELSQAQARAVASVFHLTVSSVLENADPNKVKGGE